MHCICIFRQAGCWDKAQGEAQPGGALPPRQSQRSQRKVRKSTFLLPTLSSRGNCVGFRPKIFINPMTTIIIVMKSPSLTNKGSFNDFITLEGLISCYQSSHGNKKKQILSSYFQMGAHSLFFICSRNITNNNSPNWGLIIVTCKMGEKTLYSTTQSEGSIYISITWLFY